MAANEARARDLMHRFATRTGLLGDGPTRRYLWRDAVAVCNFLGLSASAEPGSEESESALVLATRLVDDVHNTLGRHRTDDTRKGWLSGLDEESGALSPTAGGLRIGKHLPERAPGDSRDGRLEWDRDGQYFHFLTKWIQALARMGAATGNPEYRSWAVTLAKTAHARFTYRAPNGTLRMFWKMSVDLRHPAVGSMGHHDPLDALITYSELRSPALVEEISQTRTMCERRSWVTEDTLDVGGLLFDAVRAAQLAAVGEPPTPGLVYQLLRDALLGLEAIRHRSPLYRPTALRIAFRELGLVIGLQALPTLRDLIRDNGVAFVQPGRIAAALEELVRHEIFGDRIIAFWSEHENQVGPGWTEHLDINEVMLATSLLPSSFLRVDSRSSPFVQASPQEI